jgi:Na+-transporting methylmalonyl-CoA/oxaloacetate decarboxylase beta subunit
MRMILLCLNICSFILALFFLLPFTYSKITNNDEPVHMIGGSDGPTAVFISIESTPMLLVFQGIILGTFVLNIIYLFMKNKKK